MENLLKFEIKNSEKIIISKVILLFILLLNKLLIKFVFVTFLVDQLFYEALHRRERTLSHFMAETEGKKKKSFVSFNLS
jgi:hypothetical protein